MKVYFVVSVIAAVIALYAVGAFGESSPSPTLAPIPMGSPSSKFNSTELQRMSRDFTRAQKDEQLALEHQQQMERKELQSSQDQRVREWKKKEQEARHKYFAEHSVGAERRAYVKDFIDRRNSFLKMLADEKTQRVHEQDIHMNSLKEDQVVKRKEFEEHLKRGDTPPQTLWPTAGR